MDENSKVLIKNLTRYEVGFNCPNHVQVFNFQPGQTIPVKWEFLQDAAFAHGFRQLIAKAYLKILPTNENYKEIMEELMFTDFMEEIDNSLSYEEVKKMLSVVPLTIQYSKIKENLKNGTEATKKNIVEAALELKIKDYVINEAIEKATGINVIKTLNLKETPKENKPLD